MGCIKNLFENLINLSLLLVYLASWTGLITGLVDTRWCEFQINGYEYHAGLWQNCYRKDYSLKFPGRTIILF